MSGLEWLELMGGLALGGLLVMGACMLVHLLAEAEAAERVDDESEGSDERGE